MIQAASVNYLQSLGVQEIKQIADNLKDNNGQPTQSSEAVRAALQGMIACAGASAQGSSCSSAALAASASVVVSNLMSSPQGLTAEQKNSRKNLISSLVTGITAATGGDAVIANTASQIELENNSEFSRMRTSIVATIQSAAERSRSFKTKEPTKSELITAMNDLSAQLRRRDLNTDEQQGLHALWLNLYDLGQHYKILDASSLPPEMNYIGTASMAVSGGGNLAVKSVGAPTAKLQGTQSKFVPVVRNASLKNGSGDTESSAASARNQYYGNGGSATPSPGAESAGSTGRDIVFPRADDASSFSETVAAARNRQFVMLQENEGLNISPTAWDAYPTIGRNGTFISDRQGVMNYFGNLGDKAEVTISSSLASRIEGDVGLVPGTLQDGFKVRQVTGIQDMQPRSPLEGNQYFQGAGNHLPAGAPEMVINSIPTVDNGAVKTILKVNVDKK